MTPCLHGRAFVYLSSRLSIINLYGQRFKFIHEVDVPSSKIRLLVHLKMIILVQRPNSSILGPLSTWMFGRVARPRTSVEAWMTRCVLWNTIKSKNIFHDDFKDRCLKNGWLRLISDIKSCVEYFLKVKYQ